MNNRIYSHGHGFFRVIALVVMSIITFAGDVGNPPGSEEIRNDIGRQR